MTTRNPLLTIGSLDRTSAIFLYMTEEGALYFKDIPGNIYPLSFNIKYAVHFYREFNNLIEYFLDRDEMLLANSLESVKQFMSDILGLDDE